jgi:hypothetical protein
MTSISNTWRIWRHMRRAEFAQALAQLQNSAWLARSWVGLRWKAQAYYRVGMYATAAALPGTTAWPVAVSLAASDQHEKAREVLRDLQLRTMPTAQKIALAYALSPFMPTEALHLLQSLGHTAPAQLHAGLLLRTGDVSQAQLMIKHALEAGHASKYPELYLYQTMAIQGEPLQQLERLNAFLGAHAVPPVALRCVGTPPGPCNVVLAEPGAAVQGPLVSVLMTTFRTGGRASVAIESLLNQTYRNLEIIVVDDASCDGTPDLVADWARRDARVRLLRLPINGGTYLAKTMGLQLARGEFVTCHDSDDWSHPMKIERQVLPLLKDSALVATTSHMLRMQDDGVFYARSVHPLMRLNSSSPLFRRELVLQRMGAWDSVRTGADSEFYARLRLVFGKRAIKRVVQPLSLCSHREGSLMTASDTGFADTGISPQRLAYCEAWSAWHIDCLRQGKLPRLPQDLAKWAANRLFAAPEEICVSAHQIKAAQQQVQAVYG